MPQELSLLRRLLKAQQARQAPPPTAPTFSELSVFEKAIDVRSRPNFAMASAADALLKGQNPFKAGLEGFAGASKKTFADVLKTAGMDEGFARTAIGFALDILLDPTTYLNPFGAIGKAGVATIKGVPTAITKAGVATREAGETFAKGLKLRPERLAPRVEALPAVLRDLVRAGKMDPQAAIAKHFGERTLERVATGKRIGPGLAKVLPPSPGPVLAPKAITMGVPFTRFENAIPLVKHATIGKGVGAVVGAGKRVPYLRGAIGAAEFAGGAIRKAGRHVFGGKSGKPEVDVLRATYRNVQAHREATVKDVYTDLAKLRSTIAGADPARREAIDKGIRDFLEGVDKVFTEMVDPAGAEKIQKHVDHLMAQLQKAVGKGEVLGAKAATAQRIVEEVGQKLKAGAVEAPGEIKKLTRQLATQTKALAKATGPARQAIQQQIQTLNAAIQEAQKGLQKVPIQVTKRVEAVPQGPMAADISKIGETLKSRFTKMWEAEQKLASAPGLREFYMPHRLMPKIQSAFLKIYQQGSNRILKSEAAGPALESSLKRTQEGRVSDVNIQHFINRGLIDTNKLQKEMAQEGIHLTGTDLLVFEQDPIKAAFGREIASVRAITGKEFMDEVLASPTITKSSGDLGAFDRGRVKVANAPSDQLAQVRATDPDAKEFQRIVAALEQHPDHALFVPAKSAQIAAKAPEDDVITILKRVFHEDPKQFAEALGEAGAKAKIYILPVEVAEHLSKAAAARRPEALRDILKINDAFRGWWTAFATAPRPAFHTRNAVSIVWQNWLAGLTNPARYMEATWILNPARRATMKSFGGYTADQAFELMQRHGIHRQGLITSDVGKTIDTALEPSKKLLSAQGPIIRTGMKVGGRIEDVGRGALFLDALAKGMDPQAAAMLVAKYQFDYRDLSGIEKTLKQVIPFYTFTRNSIPLALEQLVTNPGKVAVLGKARRDLEQHHKALDHEYVADWINDSFGIPVRKDPKTGEISYFLLKGYLPTVDIAKFDAKDILGMLSPVIKEPIEQAMNLDFFRMKPISRFPLEMVDFMGVPMPARAAHLVKNIIIMNEADRLLFKEGAAPGKSLLALASYRTHEQDPLRQYKSYFYRTQMEMNELKYAAKRARESGRESVANNLEARHSILTARRDKAKREALKLDPKAFTRKKEGGMPLTIEGMKRRLMPRVDLQRIMVGGQQ